MIIKQWCDITDNAIKIRRTEISYRNSDGENNLCSDYLFDYLLKFAGRNKVTNH